MPAAEIDVTALADVPPWDHLLEIAKTIPTDAWVLVGGLMAHVHALLGGRESRATKDVDVLIDLMAESGNVRRVVGGLTALGFAVQTPGFDDSPVHRLTRGGAVVDLLVADHLPSRKRAAASLAGRPLMATAGAAQAVRRRMGVSLVAGEDRVLLDRADGDRSCPAGPRLCVRADP